MIQGSWSCKPSKQNSFDIHYLYCVRDRPYDMKTQRLGGVSLFDRRKEIAHKGRMMLEDTILMLSADIYF